MAYKKEHLKQLLEFVKILYNDPECKDFADGIRLMVGGNAGVSSIPKIDKIEQYLALDYGLDTAINPDFSFIKDSKVRDTLNADWREMLRFRYGLRGHSIDFGEFARYANLQMEMLIHLYYLHKYDDENAILTALQEYNASIQKNKNSTPYPVYISLQALVQGLKGEFSWNDKDIRPLEYIIKIRNEKSHRSPEMLGKSIEDLQKDLSYLEAKADRTNEEETELIKKSIKIKSLQWFCSWIQRTPFADVEMALKKLTEKIKSSITY